MAQPLTVTLNKINVGTAHGSVNYHVRRMRPDARLPSESLWIE